MTRETNILLVEDNPADQRLVTEALLTGNSRSTLHVVSDGVTALDFLRHQGKYKNSPRPQLIILDLNLPQKNGHEVLREIKTDSELHSIPVLVFSTSQAEQDISSCYDLHANAYLVKPAELDRYFLVIKSIEQFWTVMAELPSMH